MEVDLDQFDDDVNTVPQHISNTTTASSITSNRELLSKLMEIKSYNNIFISYSS
jgi:hypothetical protein